MTEYAPGPKDTTLVEVIHDTATKAPDCVIKLDNEVKEKFHDTLNIT